MKFGLDFVALDLETATWNKSSICEIGIAIVKASQIVETKSWLVKPYRNWYDPFNISIHGITPEMTKNCPAFKEVWKEGRPYLENQVVVAHNTAFDMYALKYAFEENGMPYPNFRHFCSYRVARYCFKDTYSYSLPVICERMEIPFNSHHRAGADAEACAKVFIKSLELSGVGDLEELQSKYEFRCGKFAEGVFEGQRSVKKYASSGKSIKEYVGDPSKVYEDSYFYQKSVCFTGTCKWASREKIVKSREKIIALLSENGKLTAAGLAAEIGVTAKAIEKHLAKLKAEGIIEREGPDKGGTWKLFVLAYLSVLIID